MLLGAFKQKKKFPRVASLFGAGASSGPRGGESAMKKNVSQMKEETDSREPGSNGVRTVEASQTETYKQPDRNVRCV